MEKPLIGFRLTSCSGPREGGWLVYRSIASASTVSTLLSKLDCIVPRLNKGARTCVAEADGESLRTV